MKHARQDYNRIQDPTGQIPASEPVFLLRGQDVCAPVAVQAWADEAEKCGADPAMIAKARAWAAEMITYQADKKCKMPDQPKYQVPDIVADLNFRIINSNGVYQVREVYDTTPTCLVYAYDNEGKYLWRDRWVVDEMKKNFEKGEYWAVRVGEMGDGRRVVLYDPGAIAVPPLTPPHAEAISEAEEWENKEFGDPNIDIRNIDTTTDTGQLLMAAIALITSTYQTNKTPFQVMGQLRWLQNEMYKEPNREGVQCVKCGNLYQRGDVCETCFIDAGGPDQTYPHE